MKIAIIIVLKTAFKTALKTVLKNCVKKIMFVKKNMSFLKISDPVKRDLIVKEYLETKKDNLLSEKTGEQELQTDLLKFFKPITEGLRPIREGIENLQQAITFPAYLSIQAVDDKETVVAPYFIGDKAESYLTKFTTNGEVDRTYGLYDRDGKFYIGNKPADIKDNNIIVDDEEYEGTPGLWELIVSKIPDAIIYTYDDYENYAKLMLKTNTLHRNNDPSSNYPKSSKGYKWN